MNPQYPSPDHRSDEHHVWPVACLHQGAGGDEKQNQNHFFHFIVDFLASSGV